MVREWWRGEQRAMVELAFHSAVLYKVDRAARERFATFQTSLCMALRQPGCFAALAYAGRGGFALERAPVKYSEKLRDPRWQRKRLEAMQRDDFQCQACWENTETLNVHHFYYNGDPWDAPLEALETLCETCHKERTEANRMLSGLPSGYINRLAKVIAQAQSQGVLYSHLEYQIEGKPVPPDPPRNIVRRVLKQGVA